MACKGRRTAARTRAAPAPESRREAVSKAGAWPEGRTREAAGTPEAAGMPAARPALEAAAARARPAAAACLLACLDLPDAADRRLAWPLLPLAGTILRNRSDGAAQHPGSVRPADDALVAHPDE